MNVQLWALAVAGIVVLVAAVVELVRAQRARRLALGATATSFAAHPTSSEPYILYFTGEGCTVCRTHQEPALARLGSVRIDKVDAIADRGLADRFHVYTLPTTVVMSAEGEAVHVNYGYAPAPKLERQLAQARGNLRATATA